MSLNLRNNAFLLEWFDRLIAEKKVDEVVDLLFRLPSTRLAEMLLVLQARNHETEGWQVIRAKLHARLAAPQHTRFPGRGRQCNLPGHLRDLLVNHSANKEAIGWYFRSDSRVWRLIEDHIVKAPKCCLIAREEDSIPCYRGSGHAIHFRDAYIYGDSYEQGDKGSVRIPAKVYHLDFEVEYERSEDEGGDTYSKRYSLKVPIELEDDVDDDTLKARFEAWVKRREVENQKEIEQAINPMLKRLITAYPKQARKILREMSKAKK